jgi:hypothetical protein
MRSFSKLLVIDKLALHVYLHREVSFYAASFVQSVRQANLSALLTIRSHQQNYYYYCLTNI